MVRIALAAGASVVLLAGCGGGTDSAPTTVTETVTQTSAAPQSWVMPDLIGQNLQDAQDAIQALTGNGVFFSGSTDLTGQGRNQVLDRNWQVCTSTPAPGEALSNGTSVEFGVVRIDGESCP